jgi:pyrimidine-nucleoside phosphorylase
MVYLADKANSLEEARQKLENAIQDGSALEKLKVFLSSQGGDASIVDNPSNMPQANYSFELDAKEDGYVAEIIADEVGTAAMLLGAGRATKESTIDLAVGLILKKKIGDQVQKGESLVTIYSNFENIDEVREKLYENIKVSSTKVEAPILIYGEITE